MYFVRQLVLLGQTLTVGHFQLKKAKLNILLSGTLIAWQASCNCVVLKAQKIVCEIEGLKEKETFLKRISVERSCKNCVEIIEIITK